MNKNAIDHRPFAIQEPEPELPDTKQIYTRGLTDTTHCIAMGMEWADFVHAGLLDKLEASTTLINAITASTTRGVRLPPVIQTDRASLVDALSTIGVVDSKDVRVLPVRDTMHLGQL